MARSGSKIGRKFWQGVTQASRLVITTTQAAVLALQFPEGNAETLLRSRGEILITGTPAAASDSDIVSLGLIVVSQNALVAGGASLPGPLTDLGADWLWHGFVPLDAGADASLIDPGATTYIHRLSIDSKAMRRIPSDRAVVLMAQLESGDFSAVVMQAGVRMLFGH